jgi:CubicO group peptidase (beta-lactamase class C family)
VAAKLGSLRSMTYVYLQRHSRIHVLLACCLVLSLAAAWLVGCTTPHRESGPLAQGVRPDSPRDTIGVMLAWTPEQTLVNFRHVDHFFATHTIDHGTNVLPLPKAAVQIDPLVVQSEGRPTVSVEQLMDTERITGVIAVKDGKVILERYALGRGPDDRWLSMSVAKSFTSTLIGAAVKDGLISSIEDPVVRYIPELKGTAYDGVTIRNLMTMSSGVRYREDVVDLTSDVALAGGGPMVNGVPPLVAYAARLKREARPGTRRKYQTIDADIAGIVLSRALKGRTTADYLSAKIWQPFGMEADANWVVDKAGIERGGCCLSITLRDYARYGLFVAEGGRANGIDVLPANWIQQAWTPQPSEPNKYTVGFGWYWQIRQDGGFEAVGAYGQSVTVYPSEHLTIAINSASVDPPGIGLARWDLIAAIRMATR